MKSHPRKRSLTVAMPTAHFDRRVSPRTGSKETAHGLSPQELTPTLSMLSNSFASLDNNLEMLEGGGAREGLSDECLSPVVTTRKWTKCYVERTEDKKSYHLFVEGSLRHLLTAYRVGEDFVLSQYADIASRLEEAKEQQSAAAGGGSGTFGRLLGGGGGSKGSAVVSTQAMSSMHGVNAVLRCNREAKKFSLFSHSCELCDGVLSRFTCGMDSPVNGDRQLLGEIAHSLVYMKQAATSCRRMVIELPFVHPDKSRVVWCPRAGTPKQSVRRSSLASLGATEMSPVRVRRASSSSMSSATGIREMVRTSKSSNGGGGTDELALTTASSDSSIVAKDGEASSSSSSSSSSAAPMLRQRVVSTEDGESSILPRSSSITSQDSTASTSGGGGGGGLASPKKEGKWQDDEHRHRLLLMSKLPRWNEDVDSFCMSFHGHRIKCASSKNFVFSSNQLAPDETKEKSCLQFGKQDDAGARFALDYRWPLSPVQAFGIFLTANNWVGPKHKKEK